MVGGDGEPRGRRKFIRKPKRRHAAELADDAIRVGIFGASPVINKDMALLHPGQGLSYERSLGDDQLPQKLLAWLWGKLWQWNSIQMLISCESVRLLAMVMHKLKWFVVRLMRELVSRYPLPL